MSKPTASASRPRAVLIALPLTLAALLGCSESGTGPSGNGPSLRVIAGGGLTDTVLTEPRQALVVEVRDGSNRLKKNVLVRFHPLPVEDPPYPAATSISVAPLNGPVFLDFVANSTDTRGRTAVRVRFGTAAGNARIVITVPTYGIADTATYTVTAGAPSQILFAPGDTVIRVGRQFTPNAVVADQFRNRRSDPLSFASATPACSVDVQGRISTLAAGRCAISARAGTVVDTARASVVPDGTLIALALGSSVFAGSIVQMDLDGANARRVASLSTTEAFPAAAAGGVQFAYRELDRLFVVDGAGSRRALVMPPSGLFFEGFPRYSRDGWVYFAGQTYGLPVHLFRVHTDGTGLEPVGPYSAFGYASEPDPSPDGTRIAYYGDDQIRVYELASGRATVVGNIGTMPRWSPDGSKIAYLSIRIRVVNADGSADHAVSPVESIYYDHVGLDWTADGQWLLVRGMNMLELISASTGLTLPLPFTASLFQPAVVR